MAWLASWELLLPVVLLVVGYAAGRVLERRHLASIRLREREMLDVVALSTRRVPEGVAAARCVLVSGNVVVSSDYFRSFVAGLRTLVGGRFRGYESLLGRARREALLRLKAEARAAGCDLVIGVRFVTTTIAGSATPSVEVMAVGTALRR